MERWVAGSENAHLRGASRLAKPYDRRKERRSDDELARGGAILALGEDTGTMSRWIAQETKDVGNAVSTAAGSCW